MKQAKTDSGVSTSSKALLTVNKTIPDISKLANAMYGPFM